MSAGPFEIQTRTILPSRVPQDSPPRAAPDLGPGGDELRVRAWLWRYFGIGSHHHTGVGHGHR